MVRDFSKLSLELRWLNPGSHYPWRGVFFSAPSDDVSRKSAAHLRPSGHPPFRCNRADPVGMDIQSA
jgi:hypothetical protein